MTRYSILLLFVCGWLSLLLPTNLNGQDNAPDQVSASFFGYAGVIHTPSAYLNQWGDLSFGMTHYPAATSFSFEGGQSPERSFWAHLSFLPIGEVSLKLTKPYNAQDKNYGIGDRSISFRLQLLKEKKNRPAILFGTQDPFANSAFFNTNYLVLSKTFQYRQISINTNLGYGRKFQETRGDMVYLQGVFASLQTEWRQLQFLAEFDTQYINVGLGYQYRNWLSAKVALIDLQHLSATLSVRFSLKN